METAVPQQDQIIGEYFNVLNIHSYSDIKLEIVQKTLSFCATSYRRKKCGSKTLFIYFSKVEMEDLAWMKIFHFSI